MLPRGVPSGRFDNKGSLLSVLYSSMKRGSKQIWHDREAVRFWEHG